MSGKKLFSIGKGGPTKSAKSVKKASVVSTSRKLKKPGKKWNKIKSRSRSRSRSKSPSRSKSRSRSSSRPAPPSRRPSRTPSPLQEGAYLTSIPLKYHEAIKEQLSNGNHVSVKVVRGKWTPLHKLGARIIGYTKLNKDGSIAEARVLVPSSDGRSNIAKNIPITDLKLVNPSDVFHVVPRRMRPNEVGYDEQRQARLQALYDEDGARGRSRSRSRSRSKSSSRSRSSGYGSRSSSRSRSRSRSGSRKGRSRSRSRSGSQSPGRFRSAGLQKLGKQKRRSRSHSPSR